MTRDPNSYIQASADLLAETLLKKNSDYAPAGEFSNFERAAEFFGIETIQVMLAQVGIKVTRIQGLLNSRGPNGPIESFTEAVKCAGLNESISDSLLDLAGYAIIAHAYLESND